MLGISQTKTRDLGAYRLHLMPLWGGGFLINVVFYIRGDNHEITIDSNVRFNQGGHIWFQDNNTGKRINYTKNIHIGNHVWIATHSKVLKGSFISYNSIVATNSVVTKEFRESNIIIGGSPASKIKSEISWLRERIYENSRVNSDF